MGIRRINYVILFYFLIFLSIYGIYTGKSQFTDSDDYTSCEEYNQHMIDIKSSHLELPDKVYTFLAPNDNLTFMGLYFEKEYMYYIYIELVTPHNCSKMRITIWDPDGKQFNVFESEMFYKPNFGSSYNMIKEDFQKKHSGEWILLFNDEIIDHSSNIEEILKLAEEKYPEDKFPDDAIKISKVLSGDIHLR